MAAVVDIRPPAPPASPSVRKIRAVSRGFEWLFTGMFLLALAAGVISLGLLLFYHGTMLAFGPKGGLFSTDGRIPPDYLPLRDWRMDQRLAYIPVVVVRTIPQLVLYGCLRRLFRLYRQGEVFTERTARLIQGIGAGLVAHAAAPFVCHLALSVTGYEIDKAWAHMLSLDEAMLGAVVFVIALVMQAGHEIEQDREGFV
jgi:hypothetical protein